MRIVHVIPYMHPSGGGPPVVADRFCRELAVRGWDVELLTTDALSEPGDRSWIDGYGDGYRFEVYPSWKQRVWGFSFEFRYAIEKAVRRADLVHLHNLWSYANLRAIPAALRSSTPVLLNTHGMLDPNSLARKAGRKRLYGQWLEWPRLRKVDGLLFTHEQEELLARQACPDLPKGYIVPLGCDQPPTIPLPNLRQHFLTLFPETRDKARILFLSRLHEKKGLDLLLPAMAKVREQRPDAHLVLAGGGDPRYTRHLRQWSKSLGIADNITWCGLLSGQDKWSAFAAAEAFCLPSYQENFAIVVVEAMRMEVPVVLSRRVNLWEDVVAGGAGLVCDLDATSVAEKLLQSLQDESLARRMGQCGRSLAESRFTWSFASQRLEEVYRQVLDAARPNPTAKPA